MTDQNGNTRTVLTFGFGYYRFPEIEAGQSVVLNVVSKKYKFVPQLVNVTEEFMDLNFVAQP